ncbi:Hypothetical predicted protein [Cloeon dipterum]|uniref:SAYSvFN domain-containing protein n=1 Tax=Cloeon dipterum TaxID=197152 RepID=A0A8S1DWB0_9INSE|nr:Hypothetical predicted protein [Cloeon dipterum]
MELNTSTPERELFLPAPAAPAAVSFPSGRRNVVLAGDEEAWEAEEDEHLREGIISGRIKRGTTLLLALLWLTLLLASYQLELALAYCLISAIFFVYMCTRTRPRKPNEPSAYSVFNPNCQAIDGSLTAEQFEREIRGGPASVRR